jgi:tetratricopeptide (TPR) repeat protein
LAESFARQGLMAVVDDRILESDLLGQLGESFFNKGDLKQGMVYYLQAIELGEKATRDYLSFNLSLRLYENKHELNEAIKILDDALLNQNPKQLTFNC